MLCTHCQTPNPDGAPTCMQCHESLDESGATLAPSTAGVTSTPTIAPDRKASPPRPALSRRTASGSLASFSGPSTLPEGFEIGHRYRVAKLLGRGGMGAVYRVHDLELDRDVALKLIRPEIAEDPATLERFRREIQLSSRITHRNVLRVYDLGEVEGIRFLTMQLVDGDDLASLIRREGRLPVPRVLAIFGEICKGLSAAHEQGVVHRDLKPQNIMLDAAGTAYVTDFGLAKSLAGTGMTEMGAILGTPFYMSPEQVKGEPAGPRSDIYSLGVILYEMATGVVPFTGDSAYEVMMRRLSQKPKPAAELNTEIPAFLQKIMERCMATDPAARYQSVDAVLADLATGTFSTNVRFELLQRRRVLMLAAAAVVATLAVGGVVLLSKRRPVPKAAEQARPVLVADFENRTGDPVFDGTLETAFTIALEDASFITSYRRDAARKVAEQVQPGTAGLAEPVARLVAAREGVGVVISGSVAAEGSGYKVAVRAVDAMTGKPIVSADAVADGKNAVLGAVAKLASKVRGALGDTTPESARIAAAETFTAGSFEAAHEYAVAQDLQWAGKWDEAVRLYTRALEIDPNMGRAYSGLAAIENNRGRRQDSEKYYKLALARIDRMSDREKYRTRGGYYLLLRKPDSAIEEFSALVKQYPADTAGIANLALAYFLKRDMTSALREARRAIEIYPKNVPQRNNYGFDASYSGDFETAIREQKAVLDLNPKFANGFVGLAIAQLGAGRPDEAMATWKKLAALGDAETSMAATGLADVALYEGRLADAQTILGSGYKADLARKDAEAAERKLATLAETLLVAGKTAPALAAAERARATSKDEFVEISAALVFAEAGEPTKAFAVAERLEKRLESDPQMYAKVIRAAVEGRAGKYPEALALLKEGQKLADSWLVHRERASVYLAAGSFAEADSELEICLKRKGEATAVFLDEIPTFRLYPTVYYDLGRAREGLKSPGAAEAFKTYLGLATGSGDPRVADARRRLGGS
jgi:tetratricopeptide (TPR) repeat protein